MYNLYTVQCYNLKDRKRDTDRTTGHQQINTDNKKDIHIGYMPSAKLLDGYSSNSE